MSTPHSSARIKTPALSPGRALMLLLGRVAVPRRGQKFNGSRHDPPESRFPSQRLSFWGRGVRIDV